jgi:outer membrane protein OmpA-like peptidoglycan-associated protein
MIKKSLYISTLLILITLCAKAQSYYKTRFVDAEYYFLFEEYSKALPLYQSLLEKDSLNANINYRTALCYLNMVGQKHKSIPYLEKAVKSVTGNYKEGSYKELFAPFEAFLFLGDAYRINEDLEKAIVAYKKFKSLLKPEDVHFQKIADRQIWSCENAMDMLFNPVDVEEINLGEEINSSSYEYNPCVTETQDMIFFTLSKNYEIILQSKKNIDGKWEKPKNINSVIKSDGFLKTTSISHDGKFLFFSDDSEENKGDIYMSKLNKGKPSAAEKLGKNINSKYKETHACISSDGKTIYFASDRKGGFGGLDLYKSEKKGQEWGPAINLGAAINTPYNEDAPFISLDGKSIYFSSEGHNSIGGYDLFVSTKIENDKWSIPLNLGYPISTTDDDKIFCPVDSGKLAYTYKVKNFGDNLSDIYLLKPAMTEKPSTVTFKGSINFQDNQYENLKKTNIYALSFEYKDTIGHFQADIEKQNYSFSLPVGNYDLIFKTEGYHPIYETYIIPDIRTRLEMHYDLEFVPTMISTKRDSISRAISDYVAENKTDTVKKANTMLTETSTVSKSDSITEIKSEIVENNKILESKEDTTITAANLQNSDVSNKENNVENQQLTQVQKTENPINTEKIESSTTNETNNKEVVSQKTESLIAENQKQENKTTATDNSKNTTSNELNSAVKKTDESDTKKEPIKKDNKASELFVIKSIYFDFASFSINPGSKTEIEKLYRLMDANPSLTIELLGHTDSKGNPEYNKILSEKRAKAVVNLLTSRGIQSNRIKIKAMGQDNYVAINENPDGSDNPDGRQLNRRVDINILNKGNTNIIVEDIYVPDNLRIDANTRYYVFLDNPTKAISRDVFRKSENKFIQNTQEYKTENGFLYVAGDFGNKSEAMKLLNDAIDLFSGAKIINSFEFKRFNAIATTTEETKTHEVSSKDNEYSHESSSNAIYTIQFKALTKVVDISEFKGLNNIKAISCKDGFVRYISGEFSDYVTARNEKNKIIELGYTDAFVVKIAELKSKAGELQIEERKTEPSSNQSQTGSQSGKFTIQITAMNTPVGVSHFKDLVDVKEHFSSDGFVKYTMGEYSNYNLALFDLNKIIESGYKDAFVVDYNNLNPIKEKTFTAKKKGTYTIQIKASKSKMDMSEFRKLVEVREYEGKDGYYRYAYGIFESYYDAKDEWQIIIKDGYPDAFIVPVNSYYEK